MVAEGEVLRLALPSKGNMEESTLNFLKSCGLGVDRSNPRQYRAEIPALPGVGVVTVPVVVKGIESIRGKDSATGMQRVHELRADIAAIRHMAEY